MRPPKYRDALLPAFWSCHTCKYINRTTGECKMYKVKVAREKICDAFKKRK